MVPFSTSTAALSHVDLLWLHHADDVTATNGECFPFAICCTSTVYGYYIRWDTNDSQRQQQFLCEETRLQELLETAYSTWDRNGRQAPCELLFSEVLVARNGRDTQPKRINLKLNVTYNDRGEFIGTILVPGED